MTIGRENTSSDEVTSAQTATSARTVPAQANVSFGNPAHQMADGTAAGGRPISSRYAGYFSAMTFSISSRSIPSSSLSG